MVSYRQKWITWEFFIHFFSLQPWRNLLKKHLSRPSLLSGLPACWVITCHHFYVFPFSPPHVPLSPLPFPFSPLIPDSQSDPPPPLVQECRRWFKLRGRWHLWRHARLPLLEFHVFSPSPLPSDRFSHVKECRVFLNSIFIFWFRFLGFCFALLISYARVSHMAWRRKYYSTSSDTFKRWTPFVAILEGSNYPKIPRFQTSV